MTASRRWSVVPSGDVEGLADDLGAEAAERSEEWGKLVRPDHRRGDSGRCGDAPPTGRARNGAVPRACPVTRVAVPPADVDRWACPPAPGPTCPPARRAAGSLAGPLSERAGRLGAPKNQATRTSLASPSSSVRPWIGFVIEPKGTTITSDFARAHVLAGGARVLESDSLAGLGPNSFVPTSRNGSSRPCWRSRGRSKPRTRIESEDPRPAPRRTRRPAPRPRRFRQTDDGSARATGPTVTGPGSGVGPIVDRPRNPPVRGRRRGSGHRSGPLPDRRGERRPGDRGDLDLPARAAVGNRA